VAANFRAIWLRCLAPMPPYQCEHLLGMLSQAGREPFDVVGSARRHQRRGAADFRIACGSIDSFQFSQPLSSLSARLSIRTRSMTRERLSSPKHSQA
jgi:hypothetical protein